MNPYLEQESLWPDFHQAFCTHLREELVPQVRPEFFVRLEEHIYIRELGAEERQFTGRGDVAVSRRETGSPHSAAVVTQKFTAPLRLRVPLGVDTEHSAFLELRDSKDRSLVAVIEMLSPANKRNGPDREAFLAKRRQLLASSTHYVEIDLLRGAPRMPIEELPDCNYCVLVSPYEERPNVYTWALKLRDRLPEIAIPLRAPRPHATIDLQGILHRVYDAAGYADFIYNGRPTPRLHPDDDAWATQLVAQTNG
jgi:hypothetical protein